MASKSISVELGTKQQSILRQQLENGHYENASEVVNDAVRALDERSAAYDDFLRAKIKAAVASKKPPVPIDTAFRRARTAISRKWKAAKRGA